ncbi:hypothetical protein SAMN05216436_12727 [bacterium A37T11]|nr:hypothetical protein SAMN05216436_12727 [bacterium A37T11]
MLSNSTELSYFFKTYGHFFLYAISFLRQIAPGINHSINGSCD